MPSAVKKVVITALATGGIVAGVATASASPLRTSSPVAATSTEEARLHAQVVALTGKEQALQARLRARPHVRPVTTVATPAATVVTTAPPGTGDGPGESTTTMPPVPGGDPSAASTTEPSTEPESTPSTSTSLPSESTTSPTATTGTDDDGGGHDG